MPFLSPWRPPSSASSLRSLAPLFVSPSLSQGKHRESRHGATEASMMVPFLTSASPSTTIARSHDSQLLLPPCELVIATSTRHHRSHVLAPRAPPAAPRPFPHPSPPRLSSMALREVRPQPHSSFISQARALSLLNIDQHGITTMPPSRAVRATPVAVPSPYEAINVSYFLKEIPRVYLMELPSESPPCAVVATTRIIVATVGARRKPLPFSRTAAAITGAPLDSITTISMVWLKIGARRVIIEALAVVGSYL